MCHYYILGHLFKSANLMYFVKPLRVGILREYKLTGKNTKPSIGKSNWKAESDYSFLGYNVERDERLGGWEGGEDWRDFPVDRALMAGQVDKLGGNGYNLLCSIA